MCHIDMQPEVLSDRLEVSLNLPSVSEGFPRGESETVSLEAVSLAMCQRCVRNIFSRPETTPLVRLKVVTVVDLMSAGRVFPCSPFQEQIGQP